MICIRSNVSMNYFRTVLLNEGYEYLKIVSTPQFFIHKNDSGKFNDLYVSKTTIFNKLNYK